MQATRPGSLPISIASQSYVQKRNKTELHIADRLLGRVVAAWQKWRRSALALVRLAFKRQVISKAFEEHKEAFPQVPKRSFGSPGYSTLLVHSIWTALFDRCLIKLPTGKFVSPQYGGAWTLESSSLVRFPTTVIALNRTKLFEMGAAIMPAVSHPLLRRGLRNETGTLCIIGKISSVETLWKSV